MIHMSDDYICPFCKKTVDFINDKKHIGYVVQKNLGFSTKQYFHLKCFKAAGRGKS